MQHYLTAMKRN